MEPTDVADSGRTIPTALKVVAALFILEGICAAIEILVSMLNGRLSLNFGILNFFVGLGLLRLRRGWRTCGLVFLWIFFFVAPIAGVLLIDSSKPADLKFFGQKSGTVSDEAALAFCVIVFLVCLWQYRVLTRPDIRLLFGLPPKPPTAEPGN